jgi:N-carbamoylputrescine amidase
VLLPEMPFASWLPGTDRVDAERWHAAAAEHEAWLLRLPELGAAMVASSRPTVRGSSAINEGFIWSLSDGYQPLHDKRYLPDEPGFREASWYSSGSDVFAGAAVADVTVAMLICTEIWFTEHARAYAKQGAHLLLCPRATEAATSEKWVMGGRAAAVMSGAYCLSSNRSGRDARGELWGGHGWIIEPAQGRVLALTSSQQPFVTADIDLTVADAAKGTYPRYIYTMA